MVKMKFVIDENYLVTHTLASSVPSSISKGEIVNFQNLAWKKSQSCYNLLIGRVTPQTILTHGMDFIVGKKEVGIFLGSLRKSPSFKII